MLNIINDTSAKLHLSQEQVLGTPLRSSPIRDDPRRIYVTTSLHEPPSTEKMGSQNDICLNITKSLIESSTLNPLLATHWEIYGSI